MPLSAQAYSRLIAASKGSSEVWGRPLWRQHVEVPGSCGTSFLWPFLCLPSSCVVGVIRDN